MYMDDDEIRQVLVDSAVGAARYENLFDRGDYDRGALEELRAECDVMGKALTKLLQVMVKRELLSVEDAVRVASDYGSIYGR